MTAKPAQDPAEILTEALVSALDAEHDTDRVPPARMPMSGITASVPATDLRAIVAGLEPPQEG